MSDSNIPTPKYHLEVDNIFSDESNENSEHDPMFNEEAFVKGYIKKAWEIWEAIKDKV